MKKNCYYVLTVLAAFITSPILAQQVTVSEDKEWSSQQTAMHNTGEAEFIVRIGDIDNLNFGWPTGFDPFCGRMTEGHNYPWDANDQDLPGFDRILLSSKFNPAVFKGCGGDGYTAAYNAATSKPVTYSIPTTSVKGATINNAWLQVFIDDFQSPSLCSKFQVILNGSRFAEAEKIINAIDQTGPVGKLISIPIPEEFYQAITTNPSISLRVDEATGASDGFAIDFIRLLINRKRENACKGSIKGQVLAKSTGQPIANATLLLSDKTRTQADAEGRFSFADVPAGLEVVSALSPGYVDGAGTADVGVGNDNPEVLIYLEKAKQMVFDKTNFEVGQSIRLNNVLFDQGKADIKTESKPDLDKVVAFMQTNRTVEIELAGHTSSEGEAAYNRSLSYKRVKACKDYIVSKGIDAGRIIAFGYGPDRPIAPNDTEVNRAKNRRVEMRVVKM